ncbi:MAG TPA: hypothetical protein VI895_03685 [Bdellovibrionota bacterium]|nr:hypothetical protein [Bdellovibrionota bacterium]
MSKYRSLALLVLFLSTLLTFACGSGTGDNQSNVVATPTPAPTPTVVPTPPSYNLEYFAKVSSSEPSDITNFGSDNINDGFTGSPSNVSGFIWKPKPGTQNSSYVKLEWNSLVNIDEIRLFDSPVGGQIIRKGRIKFENSKDSSKNFDPVDFENLPDDATTAGIVKGPGSPVDSVKIEISDATSDAGLAEVVVSGIRVDEEIAEGNVGLYGHVPLEKGYSSVFGGGGADVGLYRTYLIKNEKKDGTTDSEVSWVSNGNGTGAFVKMEFDVAYTIKAVYVYDRLEAGKARIKKGVIRFVDAGSKASFAKSSDPAAPANLLVTDLPTPVISKLIEIDVEELEPGTDANTGISEVEIIGSYKPAS